MYVTFTELRQIISQYEYLARLCFNSHYEYLKYSRLVEQRDNYRYWESYLDREIVEDIRLKNIPIYYAYDISMLVADPATDYLPPFHRWCRRFLYTLNGSDEPILPTHLDIVALSLDLGVGQNEFPLDGLVLTVSGLYDYKWNRYKREVLYKNHFTYIP